VGRGRRGGREKRGRAPRSANGRLAVKTAEVSASREAREKESKGTGRKGGMEGGRERIAMVMEKSAYSNCTTDEGAVRGKAKQVLLLESERIRNSMALARIRIFA